MLLPLRVSRSSNLPALVLERRHVDGLGRAALVKDEALLPAELGGHGLEPRSDVERHHLPVDSLAHGLLLDRDGLLGRRGTCAHPASTRAAAGRARSIVLLIMAFLLSSRAFGRSLRHAAPHEEPHVFILPLIDAPRAAKSKGATVAMLQDAAVFEIILSPNHLPESNRARSEGLRTRNADENVEG